MKQEFYTYLKNYSLSLLNKGINESKQNINLKYDHPMFDSGILQGNEDRDNFIKLLQDYESKGLVSLDIVKNDIAFIRWKILDNNIFHKEFDLKTLDEKIQQIIDELELNEYAMNVLYDYIPKSKKEHQEHINLFKIIHTLNEADFKGGDLRTLSVQIFNDNQKDMSKQLEKYLNTALAIIADYENIDDINFLKEKYGITRYPLPIAISGDFNVQYNSLNLSGNMPPYIMIHPEQIPFISNIQFTKVLTIENKTSFERYVREINHTDTLVIFTYGNPSSAIQDLLSHISSLKSDLQFFHWGDIDLTGIQIIMTLEDKIQKQIIPVGFTLESIQLYGTDASTEYKKELRRYKNTLLKISQKQYFELYYQALQNFIRVEQENVDPDFVQKQIGLKNNYNTSL